ncbi:MAG TPA: SDR family oxidoreductase [Acidimicrobiales bacterium]|jgi:enoyl-[acyl-carrier protein] reductase III|nr:SDR family oxidoreductase [Acidimicrobiales bacterium]
MTGEHSITLTGKVALVTGGSRGLGRSIAHRLCEAGCDVIVNYVASDEAAQLTVKEMSDLPGTALAHKGDARDPAVVAELVDLLRTRYGRLDILVHNAATWKPMSAARPRVAELWSELSLALDPLLHGMPDFVDLMAGRSGRIVAVSGNGAHEVIPGYVAVGVSKAALESLVRYLAVDLAKLGITVNAVATSMLDKGAETANPEMAVFLATRSPSGRLTRPDDVADAVALLCAEEAGWIQGQVLMVDGGLGLRA